MRKGIAIDDLFIRFKCAVAIKIDPRAQIVRCIHRVEHGNGHLLCIIGLTRSAACERDAVLIIKAVLVVAERVGRIECAAFSVDKRANFAAGDDRIAWIAVA